MQSIIFFEQLDELLEERQKKDRRKAPKKIHPKFERRKKDRRK